MKDKFSDVFKAFGEKLKSSRKLQIGLAVGLAIILIVIYFAFIRAPSVKNEDETDLSSVTEVDAYAEALENKLENVLSGVKGAGEVDVMVTLASGFEYVYATEDVIKETSSGTITTSSIILVSGEPVVVKKIFPEIAGVLVTATGADNISVKVDLVTAIQTVIDVANEDITILTRV